MKVGSIGTEAMGQPMGANLVGKEFEVVGYDVVPATPEATIASGGARSAAECLRLHPGLAGAIGLAT